MKSIFFQHPVYFDSIVQLVQPGSCYAILVTLVKCLLSFLYFNIRYVQYASIIIIVVHIEVVQQQLDWNLIKVSFVVFDYTIRIENNCSIGSLHKPCSQEQPIKSYQSKTKTMNQKQETTGQLRSSLFVCVLFWKRFTIIICIVNKKHDDKDYVFKTGSQQLFDL